MTRLLLDEMLAPAIATQLRRRGHDAVAVADEPSLRGVPDDEVLAHATAAGRAVVTMNVADFARLDAAWRSLGHSHGGLILVPSAAFPQNRGFVGLVVRAIDAASADGTIPGPDGVLFLSPAPSRRPAS